MVKKRTITVRNQQKFVILTIFIFLIEALASFIFTAQNDFLRYASEGLLLVTIASSILPALLFVLAFAFMKKSTLLRRLTQAIVWTFGSMLVYVLAALVWYVSDPSNYNLLQLLVGPAIITITLQVLGLLIYRSNSKKADKLLMPRWFEKVFILIGSVYIIANAALIVKDLNQYGGLMDTYILYSVVPLVLWIFLIIIGFISLRSMKDKISRLYTAMFGVSFTLYVGAGLAYLGNVTLPSNSSVQEFLTVGSYVVTTIVYLILLKIVYDRVKANEKL